MKSVKHTHSYVLNQPVDVLFPLYSAEGEKLWVPGWDYTSPMNTTDLHEDFIFLTGTHDHSSTQAIWLVKRYEPDVYFVQFYKVEPGDKVGIISVQCTPLAPDKTDTEVSYEYIALSEKGEQFIASFTAEHYVEYIGEWESLLKAFFAKNDG